MKNILDPIKFAKLFWPDVAFYREQREILYSVRDNDETIVPAGNMLGKDFVAGFVALWYFMAHVDNPTTRIITTSVKDDHLRVLWGEIGNFIRTSKYPLATEDGGQLIYTHRELKKLVHGKKCEKSYVKGMVSLKGEGMAGHHAPNTLCIIDEASGVEEVVYTQADTWSKKFLIIGNPNPCNNFFFTGVRDGDLKAETNNHLYRKVIKIRGQDSPNVRLAEAEISCGLKPSGKEITPGVLSYDAYVKRRATWDPVRQCIGVDGEFYKGAEILLFPPDWLNRAENIAAGLPRVRNGIKVMGVDPAEGGDDTSWCIIDELGIVEMLAMKTPDTTMVTSHTLAFMQQYNILPKNVLFDRGGGGKEHADRLRSQGYNVRTISFGEAAGSKAKFTRSLRTSQQYREEVESRYTFRNRRSEMYGITRQMLDPAYEQGFGIPVEYTELRRQMALIPLMYDDEGRLELLPKNKRVKYTDLGLDRDTEGTLVGLLGCSPDEADSLVLAIFGMFREDLKSTVGAV